ncbi:DUF7669 domain-containing protein [Deinococcus navajonensis]|uniref:DUF7669 domain-containing protein n=1 Tax=Deinococcus navajonensis TaxID=309884 RepID=A0ABV8XJB4_9DEIO
MRRRKRVSCREDVLEAARVLSARHAEETFSIPDVIDVMRSQGTEHLDTVIRRHVGVLMCVNGGAAGAGEYRDLERVARGRYRLLPPGDGR